MLLKFYGDRPTLRLYLLRQDASVSRMLHPIPRADRWDPWIVAALCAVAIGAALIFRLM